MKLILAMLVFLMGCMALPRVTLQEHHQIVGTQNIHYYQSQGQSKGSPIVLLTGVGTTGAFWNRTLIDCLAENHTVYILDYPEIQSTISVNYFASIVNLFIKQNNLLDAELIGWSMGGSVALEASFIEPSLYKKLFLLSAYIPTGANISYPFPTHPAFRNDQDVLNYVFQNNLANYQPSKLDFYREQLIKHEVSALFPSSSYTLAELDSILSWGNTTLATNQFRNSRVPAVFLVPTNDRIIQEDLALKTIQHYGNLDRILSISGSGHDVSLQEPLTVCRLVESYQ